MMYNNYSQDYDLQNQAKEHKTGLNDNDNNKQKSTTPTHQ